jgi:hypothetical protein
MQFSQTEEEIKAIQSKDNLTLKEATHEKAI